MVESFRTKVRRWGINLIPTVRRSKARVTYLSEDYREIHVELDLKFDRRNYVGSEFGGSIFSSVDPFYIFMFTKVLGPNYIVWDMAVTTNYLKPGRSRLFAKFKIEQEEIDSIKEDIYYKEATQRKYHLDMVDEEGEVCATLDKKIYFKLR